MELCECGETRRVEASEAVSGSGGVDVQGGSKVAGGLVVKGRASLNRGVPWAFMWGW